MSIHKQLPLLITLATAGCGVPVLGQFGEDEDTICDVTSRTPVGMDDQVTVRPDREDVEIVVRDAVASATGSRTSDLTWEATGEVTELTLVLSGAYDVELVVYTYVGSDTETGAPAVDPCPTQLEFSVDVQLSTADGRLAEAFTSHAAAFGDGVGGQALLEDPAGTVDPIALSTSDEAVQAAAIELHFWVPDDGAGMFSGAIEPVLVERPGDDVRALASWPGESAEQ